MSWRYYYRDNDGSITEFTSRVQVGYSENPGTDGLVMNAEEGTVGASSLTVDDPLGNFLINGHRRVHVIETECVGDAFDGMVWAGYVAKREISREGEFVGVGRTWKLHLDDINTIIERRIMFGAENKRPAETDVERITWLLTTNEAALIDDDTYFSSDEPVAMDKCDYRNQSFRAILDDCAQQSGKNWYLWASADGWSLWYGPRGTTDFSTDLRISNDPAEIDSVDTFAAAQGTVLSRDPTRVYSGMNVAYDGGNTYTQDDAIAAAFARRDVTSPAVNVKTAAKAKARGRRLLRDIATEEDIITTAITVPRADSNRLVAGHRVEVRFTHFPGYEDWVWMRAVNRTIREINADLVEISVELAGDAPAPASPPTYGMLYVSGGPYTTENGVDLVHFAQPGDTPGPGFIQKPTVGLISVLTDASPPHPDRTHYGWQIDGDGEVDVITYCSVYGIKMDNISYTWTLAIRLNGTVVASNVHTPVPGNLSPEGWDPVASINGLAVVNGDVITVTLESVPYLPAFWRTPFGTGQSGERLEITGGTLT